MLNSIHSQSNCPARVSGRRVLAKKFCVGAKTRFLFPRAKVHFPEANCRNFRRGFPLQWVKRANRFYGKRALMTTRSDSEVNTAKDTEVTRLGRIVLHLRCLWLDHKCGWHLAGIWREISL